MSDPLELRVECSNPDLILSTLLRINNKQLPVTVRRRFGYVLDHLVINHTEEQILDLTRGRTVGELLRQYEASIPKPIESGERDGVKWELFRKPGDDQTA